MKVLKKINAVCTFHAESNYVNHVMLCSTYRLKCETCERLFKKESYLRSRYLARQKKKFMKGLLVINHCMENADLEEVHSETESKTEEERLKTPIGDHQDGQGSLPDNQEKLVNKIELSKVWCVYSNLSIHDNEERLQETYTINESKNDRVDTNLGP